MKKCRISGEKLTPIVDFGEIYLNDFLKYPNKSAPTGKLKLGFGKQSKLLQLLNTADHDKLYRNYWYRSGTNRTMNDQLKDIVNSIPKWITLNKGDVVLDIGCNDGTLLKHYNSLGNYFKVGIDPAKNIGSEGKKNANAHAVDFFNKQTFKRLSKKKAKVITTIAMFYDLEKPNKFMSDLCAALDKDGIWILQVQYTPLMISLNAFDNIVHEHIEYYTLESLIPLFSKFKLEIVDAEINDVNAGSIRLTVKKQKKYNANSCRFYKGNWKT